jgi:hypothetical protein
VIVTGGAPFRSICACGHAATARPFGPWPGVGHHDGRVTRASRKPRVGEAYAQAAVLGSRNRERQAIDAASGVTFVLPADISLA